MATEKRTSRIVSDAASTAVRRKSAGRRVGAAAAKAAVPATPRGSAALRLVDEILTNLSASKGRAKRKVSVSVDADLWDEVSRLVDRDAATTASAAVEGALAMWAANERLRELLDEFYQESPDSRPTEEQVTAAAELLGLS